MTSLISAKGKRKEEHKLCYRFRLNSALECDVQETSMGLVTDMILVPRDYISFTFNSCLTVNRVI